MGCGCNSGTSCKGDCYMGVCWDGCTPWCGCQEDDATDEICMNDTYYLYVNLSGEDNAGYYVPMSFGYAVITSTESVPNGYSSVEVYVLTSLCKMYMPDVYTDYFQGIETSEYYYTKSIDTSNYTNVSCNTNSTIEFNNCYISVLSLSDESSTPIVGMSSCSGVSYPEKSPWCVG